MWLSYCSALHCVYNINELLLLQQFSHLTCIWPRLPLCRSVSCLVPSTLTLWPHLPLLFSLFWWGLFLPCDFHFTLKPVVLQPTSQTFSDSPTMVYCLNSHNQVLLKIPGFLRTQVTVATNTTPRLKISQPNKYILDCPCWIRTQVYLLQCSFFYLR